MFNKNFRSAFFRDGRKQEAKVFLSLITILVVLQLQITTDNDYIATLLYYKCSNYHKKRCTKKPINKKILPGKKTQTPKI